MIPRPPTTLRSSLRFQYLFLMKWRPLGARAFRAVERGDAAALPDLIRRIAETRTADAHPRWVRDLMRRLEVMVLVPAADVLHDPGLLDRAVALSLEAVTDTPTRWESEVFDRALLADCLLQRFEKRGDRADVDEAITHQRRAAELCRAWLAAPRGYWRASLQQWWRVQWYPDEGQVWPPLNRTICFSVLLGLGDALHTRFEFLRTYDDLQRAVEASDGAEALSRTFRWAASPWAGNYKQERGSILSQLGALLTFRFELLHDPTDIIRAVSLLEDADRLTPRRARGGRSVARYRVHALTTRGLRLQSLDDFTKAEAVLRRRTPHDPAWRPQVEILTGRAAISESSDGLGEAVHILEAAVSQGGADVHEALIWLASTLRQWALHAASVADSLAGARDETGAGSSAETGAQGASWTRPDVSDTVVAAQQEAAVLWRRSSDAWRRAALLETAPAWRRLHAASRWRSQVTEPREAADASSLAVRLLPLAAWRGLDRISQEEVLQTTDFDLASGAAADQLDLHDADHALELLELGRGVLWSQTLDVRTDLQQLRQESPRLAERLTRLRVLLEESRDPAVRAERAGLRPPV
ncbi:hypothetical protein J0X20_02215 [Streptomyces sp. KCTC 0041BP]|uniref:hypothetical protein n=1 Tax=Streptomyces sp. KCTC 0041BP TaxID=201500 RepID=UPI001AEA8485|nr:hypothetical protein [Streptomyces sp. KCTC 0041BP]MBP0932459.1 hypothetical protein [Streptomyces sp. KCTC 0041BP]